MHVTASHPHVLWIHGVVLQPEVILVSELMPGGPLDVCCFTPPPQASFFPTNPTHPLIPLPQRFLQTRRPTGDGPVLEMAELWNMACQLASALNWLEKHAIVHRDVAARNVLVHDESLVKLADFGISRQLSTAGYYRKRSINCIPIRCVCNRCAPSALMVPLLLQGAP